MSKRETNFRSPLKQKVLILLAGGLALGLSRSPRRQKHIFHAMKKTWRDIDRRYLYRTIHEFRNQRLVDYQEQPDGHVKIVITEKGKQKSLSYKIDEMTIERPRRWDGKFRLVFFDIPEKKRAARDALRDKLKELGFHELQKSVMIFPYSCEDEINFIVEFFEIRPWVRLATCERLTNAAELRLRFGLS